MFNIILVDDESFTIDTLTTVIEFEKLGFNLAGTFYDGSSALSYIKENNVDVVITDINMPGISGLDLLHEIKKSNSQTEVVFLTAYAEFDYAAFGIDHGLYKYMLKPVTISAFEELLNSLYSQLSSSQNDENEPSFGNCLKPSMQKEFYEYMYKINAVSVEKLQSDLDSSQFIYDLSKDFCTIADINFIDLEGYFAKSSNFDYTMLFQSVKNIMCRNEFLVCPLVNNYGYLTVLILAKSKTKRDFVRLVNNFAETLTCDLAEILDVQVSVTFSRAFDNISELSEYNRVVLSARHDAETLFEAIQKQKKPHMYIMNKLDSLIIEHSSMEYYTDSLAYSVYLLALSLIDLSDLHKFKLYSENIKIPLELDEANVPKQTAELVNQLPKTVENLIKYFSSNIPTLHGTAQKAIKYIREHYCEKISLDDVSKYVYCNPTYLSRILKQATGLSFTNYLNNLRISRAEQLLMNTDLTVYEISRQIGYNSIGYFYRKFREKNNCSPDNYKNGTNAET